MLILSGLLLIAGIGAISLGIKSGLLPLCLGVILLVVSLMVNWRRTRFPRLFKIVYRTIAVLICLVIAISVVASAQILSKYFDQEPPDDAIMIVLGCGLNPVDHTSPDLMLQGRLNVAYAYLSAHPDTLCVVSGGQGKDEYISEAKAMADDLTQRGIDADRIYLEDKSTNTNENIAFSKQLLVEKGMIQPDGQSNLIVATDGFHEFRAQHIASKSGFHCYTLASYAPFGLTCYFWLREIAGVVLQVWI